MSTTRIIYKLKKAFRELGIDLKRSGRLYELEYEHLQLLLSLDNESASFAFIANIIDAQGSMSEEELKIALDVVEGFHKNYYGEWNDGMPYFVSPEHFIGDRVEVTRDWLGEQLKAFWDAYMFLQANLFLIGDMTTMDFFGQNK